MAEHDGSKRKSTDIEGGLGISRRDMLRRSAVVGGTLLWVAPAIQSVAPAASAQAMGRSPGGHACCYCFNGNPSRPSPENPTTGRASECSINGTGVTPRMNRDDCENYCHGLGYSGFQYMSSTQTFEQCGPSFGGCVAP